MHGDRHWLQLLLGNKIWLKPKEKWLSSWCSSVLKVGAWIFLAFTQSLSHTAMTYNVLKKRKLGLVDYSCYFLRCKAYANRMSMLKRPQLHRMLTNDYSLHMNILSILHELGMTMQVTCIAGKWHSCLGDMLMQFNGSQRQQCNFPGMHLLYEAPFPVHVQNTDVSSVMRSCQLAQCDFKVSSSGSLCLRKLYSA